MYSLSYVNMMDDTLCAICLDRLDEMDCTELICKHKYHSDCLYNYFYFKVTKGNGSKLHRMKQLHCPTCRQMHICSLRHVTSYKVAYNEEKINQLTNVLAATKTRHKWKRWMFKIKAIMKKPTKMEVFDYIQLEDELYEHICEMEDTLKGL